MPSTSFEKWRTIRAASLDEIEAAHSSLGGTGRGRRYATQQVNQAYVVLLSSQFQGFCRDLHTECVEVMIRAVPASLQTMMEEGLKRDRRMDKGNPNPGNIGSDFGRFDMEFWSLVYSHDARNNQRRRLLDDLNKWRNAVAHQDFDPVGGDGAAIQLLQVQRYRAACDNLAKGFDAVLYAHLMSKTGVAPW